MPHLMGRHATTLSLLVLLVLPVMTSTIGCGTEAPPEPVVVAQNNAIDAPTREAISALNTRILNGMLGGDATPLRELFLTERLTEIENGPGLDPVFAQMAGALTDTTLTPYHEFSVTLNEPQPEGFTVPAEGEDRYSLRLPPSEPGRLYVSLIRARAATRDHLVALVYEQRDDSWRLSAMRVGGLRIGSRNALDWYADARRLADEQLYVPAAMRLMVAGGLLRPMPFIRYDDEAEVLALEQQVSQTLAGTYSFPLELDGLPGKPKVIRLEPVFQRGTLLTMVSYVSGQKLDQAVIDAEVAKVHPRLAERLTGLCHDASRVAYKAFAEPPLDPQKSYDFINAVADCAPGNQ